MSKRIDEEVDSTFEKRLTQLETSIKKLSEKSQKAEKTNVGQEHRFAPIIINLYDYLIRPRFRNEELDEGLEIEALSAAVLWFWRLKRRTLVVASAGGLIAILTLAVGYWTLLALKEQNQHLWQQNELVANQFDAVKQQMRSANSKFFSEFMEDVRGLRYTQGLSDSAKLHLPPSYLVRLRDLARLFYPDQIIDLNYPDIAIEKLVSSERGFLLEALVNARVMIPRSFDFSHVYLRAVDFSYADLRGIYLTNSYLENVRFSGADLGGVNFSNTYLHEGLFDNVNLNGANLDSAIFYHTDLKDARISGTFGDSFRRSTSLRGASFLSANLEGTVIAENDSLEARSFEGSIR